MQEKVLKAIDICYIFTTMLKAQGNIKNTKHILLMWFVLFSLSPCIVKEALFHSANGEYVKPLNKTKTTTLSSLCQYSPNESHQISVAKQVKIYRQIEPVNFTGNQQIDRKSTRLNSIH